MFGINRAEVLGNVGGDPVIRTTQEGKKMATFSVATPNSWKNPKTGEITEKTDWHNIVVFNDYFVKMVEQGVKKGTRVMCVGALQTTKYTGNDGVERYATKIVLQGFNSRFEIIREKSNNDVSENFEGYVAESSNTILEDDIPY